MFFFFRISSGIPAILTVIFVVFLSTSKQISGDYLYDATIAFFQVPLKPPTHATIRHCTGGATLPLPESLIERLQYGIVAECYHSENLL
jgi:hypothetical protein